MACNEWVYEMTTTPEEAIRTKTEDVRLRYVELRAEGKSYSAITAELHISKGTCTAWERELAAEINKLKQEKLNALYEAYAMTKEARIKRLGSTLDKIDAALEEIDLSAVAPEKLLDLKLKYAKALKEEYTGAEAPLQLEGMDTSPEAIMEAMADLHARIRAGEVSTEQATTEARALAAILTAYDSTTLKKRLELLTDAIEGRK